MSPEPISPGDPMTVRLVGGPFDGRIMPLPGKMTVWEIAVPAHWTGATFLNRMRVPERRHRYRLDPHWSEFVGVEALPFVYAGVVEEEAET